MSSCAWLSVWAAIRPRLIVLIVTLGTGGEWSAVIGLTCLGHQLCHGYERSPDLRRAKANVQRGQVRCCKPLLTFAPRCEVTQLVARCNTRGSILAHSSNNRENGALGSRERTAGLRMLLAENCSNL